MAVSISGLVSGVDVQSLVSTISAAYQRPITVLQDQQREQQATLSAWGRLQGSLSSLQSTVAGLQNVTQLNNRSVSASTAGVVSASVDANAPEGSYTLTDVTLAQSQSLYSQAFASATNTAIGTGTLQIQVGSGSPKSISIDGSNNTLNGIAAAINSAGAGVSAAVVFDGSGYRLTLSGNSTGAANAFKVSVSGATGSLGALAYDPATPGAGMTQSQAAQDASVRINGLLVTSANNTISGAIPGVKFDLLQAGGSTKLTVAKDSAAFVKSVESFVSAFNKAMGTLNEVTAFVPGSNGAPSQSGPLLGDIGVQNLRTQMLNLISGQGVGTRPGATYASLGSVGISLAEDGTLALDSGKLTAALKADYEGVTGLFGQVGSASNSNVRFVGATTDTQPGTYALSVSTPASPAVIAIAPSIASGGLATAEALTFTSGTKAVTVNLDAGATLQQVISTINARLREGGLSGIEAAEDGGGLRISTQAYGSGQSFSVVSDQAAGPGSTGIGTTVLSATGVDVAGSVNGQTTRGSGQRLTVTGPGAALGLQLDITGPGTGSLGTVTLSQGLYQQLNSVLVAALNSRNGFVAAATQGINASIASIDKQIAQLQQSVEAQTALLQQQFDAMQSMMTQFKGIGQYLTAYFDSVSSSKSSSKG
jgi:flagellar hook-associated protein 2